MTGAAKILAVYDEPDFEALLTQRFRRQICLSLRRSREEALAALAQELCDDRFIWCSSAISSPPRPMAACGAIWPRAMILAKDGFPPD